ncbi:hypothetical protein M413DRAFT_120506 [Hebeloma cylindrosporum]|uniref:DUF6533 domain-containing protein n=1 Tax=Hebeloma cylindrosporum TaxID=76867 RepID=A0A0C2XYC0_HEBCY|nr:hypothetical protein M413DRAFT_120506 [Hebeloma cylindrosporum h7]
MIPLTAAHIAKLRVHFVPRYVTFATLSWVIQDYFITLEDEVTYFWSRKPGFGAFIFVWMRYYTIFLVVFDTLGFFVISGPKSVTINAVLSAISLWSVEIIMQVRIYLLFDRSKRVAFVNGALFAISVGFFVWIKVVNALHAIGPRPKRGDCSTRDTRWAQWLPDTVFELVLFGMAVYKALASYAENVKLNGRQPLSAILLHGNIAYFFVVACVLVLSNLMLVCSTHIPYLGLGSVSFHIYPSLRLYTFAHSYSSSRITSCVV